jgi:hypothetical protein
MYNTLQKYNNLKGPIIMRYLCSTTGNKKENKRILIVIIICLLTLYLFLPVYAPTTDQAGIRNPSGTRSRLSTFNAMDIAHVHGGSLAGALEPGNFDDDELTELVVVGGSSAGEVNVIDYNLENSSFISDLVWWDPNGALVDAAVGELDSSNSRPEILVGGYSGNLTMLKYDSGILANNVTLWNTSQQTANISKLNYIFGIDIGNLDSRYPGNEIAVADASTYFVYILTNSGGTWQEHKIPLDDIPRNLVVGDFDSSHAGSELLVLCINGIVYKVESGPTAGNWTVVELFVDSDTPFNAVFADFDPAHTGNEIIITGLSEKTTLVWGEGDSWNHTVLWRAPGALEGIAYGDFDLAHDGNELCLAGYSNTAIMLYESPPGWYDELIYSDPDPLQTELNGVVISDIYPDNPGTELVIIGFTGKVRMLTFVQPDFDLTLTSASKKVVAGEFTSVQVIIEVISNYESPIRLTIAGLPQGSTYNFSKVVVDPNSPNGNRDIDRSDEPTINSVLTIYTSASTPTGTYDLTITGTGIDDNKIKTTIFKLEVLPRPEFELEVRPEQVTLNLSKDQFHTEFVIEIKALHGFTGITDLEIDASFFTSLSPELSDNIDFDIKPKEIDVNGTATINISISSKLKTPATLIIPIKATNLDQEIEKTYSVQLTIEYTEPEDSDSEPTFIEGYIALGMLTAVIVILLTFMIKRFRQMSERQENWRAQRLEAQKDSKRFPRQRNYPSKRRSPSFKIEHPPRYKNKK